MEPLNGIVRRNMALVLCRLDRWDEGIEELRDILRHDPDDAETSALTIALDQARAAKRVPVQETRFSFRRCPTRPEPSCRSRGIHQAFAVELGGIVLTSGNI